MSFEEVVRAGESEIPLFQRGRDAAAGRLRDARNLCDAVANQDLAIQAQATIDLEDARAVGSEWGLVSIDAELRREFREGRGLL